MKYVKFGNFFEKIVVQVEKKNIVEKSFEWSAASHPDGVKSDSFRVKIYAEKLQSFKVLFYRVGDPRQRYELSPKLRQILPNIAAEVPEEDVLLSLWYYIVSNRLLLDSRDRKRALRLDEVSQL